MIRSYRITVSLFLFVLLLTACCADIQIPASVKAEPLYEAKTPQDRVENLWLSGNLRGTRQIWGWFCGKVAISPPICDLITATPREPNLSELFHQEFLDHLNAKEITLTDKFLFVEMDPAAFIRVEIELRKSEDDSAKRYKEECEDIHSCQFPDQFSFVGSPGNQYCVSYIKQARSGPESSCTPYGKYYTKAVFQKGQILFIFRIWTFDKIGGTAS